jgi:hypothetical protein
VSEKTLLISVPLTRKEFNSLRQLQLKARWDWPATFSANEHGEVWPYVTPGYTREKDRFHLRGALDLLDYLADVYLGVRPEGGRFFLDDQGAYFGESSSRVKTQFAKFSFVTSMDTSPRAAIKSHGPGRTPEQLDRHNDQVCREEVCPFCTDERLRKLSLTI